MAVAPDRRVGAWRVHERIVLGNTPIVVDAVDLAEPVFQILRVLHRAAFTEREEEMSLAVPGEARSEMHAARHVQLRRRSEDHLLFRPLVVLVDLSANDDGVGRRLRRSASPSALTAAESCAGRRGAAGAVGRRPAAPARQEPRRIGGGGGGAT